MRTCLLTTLLIAWALLPPGSAALAVQFSGANLVDLSFDGSISVDIVDLDGDGDQDILGAATFGNEVRWWENTAGDGSIWLPHTVATGFRGARTAVGADIDGDGDQDVVGAAITEDDIVWWENTAGNGLSWTEHVVDGKLDGARAIAVVDMGGSSSLDIVGAGQFDDTVAWWENTAGNGTAWTEHTVDSNFDGAADVAVADMDGDLDLDVIGVAVIGDDIAWWENTAGNGLSWTEHLVDDFSDGAVAVVVDDMDSDGDQDIIAAAKDANTVTWWENMDGAGTFTPVVSAEHTVDDTFTGARSVWTTDIDDDGDPDIFGTARDANILGVWENVNNNASWELTALDVTFDGGASVTTGDIDGDGNDDVLGAAINSDAVVWWRNMNAPSISPEPSALDFGNRDIDSGSTADATVTVTNIGTSTLTFSSFHTITGDNAAEFGVILTDGGLDPLAPGASREIFVVFDPAVTGVRAANLEIHTNDPVTPTLSVPLSGTGTDQEIDVAPASLNLGQQDIDLGATASSPVTITNTGTADLTLTGVIAIIGTHAADFSITNDSSGAILAPLATRTVQIAFDPSATGARSATLSIPSDDSDEPTVTIALSGTGTVQVISTSATSLLFPGTDIDEGSAPTQTLVITSTGTADLVFSQAIALGGAQSSDFTIASDTGEGTLSFGESRTLEIGFDPTATGQRQAQVEIRTAGSALDVPLSGLGIDQQISIFPTSLDFGWADVTAGATPALTVTISNLGDGDLDFTAPIAISGEDAADFAIASDTGEATLAPSQSRTLGITFDPSAIGAHAASLEILSNTNNVRTDAVALMGIGTTEAVNVTPGTIDFGDQDIGAGPTAARTVTVSNFLEGDDDIGQVSFTGADAADFAHTATPPTPLVSGASVTFEATFDPTTTGAKAASLEIFIADAGITRVVSVTGNGIVIPTGRTGLTTAQVLDALLGIIPASPEASFDVNSDGTAADAADVVTNIEDINP